MEYKTPCVQFNVHENALHCIGWFTCDALIVTNGALHCGYHNIKVIESLLVKHEPGFLTQTAPTYMYINK